MSPVVGQLEKDKVKSSCSCPSKEVTASVGETVTLPCPIKWTSMGPECWKVTWEKKLETGGECMVHCQVKMDEAVIQSEEYVGRTSLSPNWTENGNGALELQRVTASDAGDYVFWITQLPEGQSLSSMCCEVTLKVQDERSGGGQG